MEFLVLLFIGWMLWSAVGNAAKNAEGEAASPARVLRSARRSRRSACCRWARRPAALLPAPGPSEESASELMWDETGGRSPRWTRPAPRQRRWWRWRPRTAMSVEARPMPGEAVSLEQEVDRQAEHERFPPPLRGRPFHRLRRAPRPAGRDARPRRPAPRRADGRDPGPAQVAAKVDGCRPGPKGSGRLPPGSLPALFDLASPRLSGAAYKCHTWPGRGGAQVRRDPEASAAPPDGRARRARPRGAPRPRAAARGRGPRACGASAPSCAASPR